MKNKKLKDSKELDIQKKPIVPAHMEDEKCCGECSWFYGEDTYGFGSCPFQFGEIVECGKPCVVKEEFVSKKEMRHHMAVLLRADRRHIAFYGKKDALTDAAEFAYKYMKVFSEL